MVGETDVCLEFDDEDDITRADLIAEFLASTPGVGALVLTCTEIPTPGLLSLFTVLSHSSSVKGLHIHWILFEPEEIVAISSMIKQNTSLTSISLVSNKLSDKDLEMICEALALNSTVKWLDLSKNRIGEEGAHHLNRLLKRNATIISLKLYKTRIGDAGAIAIATGLKNNVSLRYLRLRSCRIGNVGAIAIAEALKHSLVLFYLGLDRNEIDSSGILAIAEALKQNRSLEVLKISLGIHVHHFENAFVDALEHNVSLVSLRTAAEWKSERINRLLLRNREYIPAVVRAAALLLIGIRRSPNFDAMGAFFGICCKDVVRVIAMEVWATRKDPIWIQALSEYPTGQSEAK